MATKMNTTRRKILAGLASLPVTGGVSTFAIASEPELAELIAAHKAAYVRLDRAVGARNDIEETVDDDRRKNPVLVPLAVMPNGECHSGYYELGPISPDEIRKGIRDTHDSLRRIHCSKWSRVMFPELAVAAERELEASQARALQALADAEAGIEERERNSGLTAAEEAVDAADEDEFKARLALVIYAPRNDEEALAKREYIEKSPPFRDGWCSDNTNFVEAMIEHLNAVRV